MLQIFYTRVQTFMADCTSPIKVYGYIAVRDSEDYRRIYLFNRSRDNPLTINSVSIFYICSWSVYLQLLSCVYIKAADMTPLLPRGIEKKNCGHLLLDTTLTEILLLRAREVGAGRRISGRMDISLPHLFMVLN
jgi:hypothetical protein